MQKTTISIIRADVGSFPGHSRTHPKLLEKAAKILRDEEGKLLIDSFVTHCGDDIELIMTHTHGVDSEKVHKLARDTFTECTAIAKSLKLEGAGQDITPGTFSGKAGSPGPGAAEMEFEERESDPVLVFMADKTSQGAWNFFLYKIFADPFNTPGLVTDPAMHRGFDFEVHDIVKKRRIRFRCPEEIYSLLAFIGDPSRYVIKHVFNRDGDIAASTSARPVNRLADRCIGNDDPVMIVRAQNGFPAVGEVLDPFCTPVIVAGWMRGSHRGPLMPVGLCEANCTRFDGPSRVTCFGFQINNGKLVGPADMFDDPAFDRVRNRCNELADTMRAQGPFEPHRIAEEMEQPPHTRVEQELSKRWEPLPP